MDPLGTIAAFDGITYTITEWDPWERLGDGRWLGGLTLEDDPTLNDPDAPGYAVCAIVPDGEWTNGPIFTPFDWQDGEMACGADDIPSIRWVDLRTGHGAVMMNGLPHPGPFSPDPDERPGSYGRD